MSVGLGQEPRGLLRGTDEVCVHMSRLAPTLLNVGLEQPFWAAWVEQCTHDRTPANRLWLKGFAAKISDSRTTPPCDKGTRLQSAQVSISIVVNQLA